MFKKEQSVLERSRSTLKNKEVRQLRSDVQRQFPYIAEAELSELLPNKATITCVKLASKALLYLKHDEADGVPVPYFVDMDGRRRIMPTVYALWICPHLMKPLYVHPPVSEFILNGADLMLPGVLGELSDTVVGEGRCIIARGNPLPFAVGEMLVNGAHIAQHGKKGKGLRVVHCFGDLLWLMGGGVYPNDGFGRSAVFSLESGTSISPYQQGTDEIDQAKEASSEHHHAIEYSATEDQLLEEEPLVDEDIVRSSTDPCEVKEGEISYHHTEDEEDEIDDLTTFRLGDYEEEKSTHQSAQDTDHVAAAGSEADAALSDEETTATADGEESLKNTTAATEAMDALLHLSFMSAIKYGCKDKQLPILASTFYSLYLLPSRPQGCTIEIRRSSFKKVTKFLQQMQRAGLITLQDNNGVVSISTINRRSPAYITFAVDDVEQLKVAIEEAQGLGAKKEDSPPSYIICALFKLTKPMKDVFGQCFGQYGEYLKADEAKSVLMSYVKNRELEMADKSRVRLDPHLCDLLYKKKRKTGSKAERREMRAQVSASVNEPMERYDEDCAVEEHSPALAAVQRRQYPDDVLKVELIKEFMDKIPEYYAIVSDALPNGIHIGSGALPKVEMLLENRQGNKVVTRVSGLEVFGISPDTFARDCQRKFACSATTNQITGKKTKEVVVQGHLSQEMKEWLHVRYGLPERLVDIEIRKGVKPKKKAR